MNHPKHNYYLAFISLSLLLCTCKSSDNTFDHHLLDKKYYLTGIPPNGVRIAKNLFYDQTELTNINWREYLYWTYRVFGANSVEYKSCLPDTDVWHIPNMNDSTILKNEIICLIPNSVYYFRNPIFQDFPVVGVSQKQAIDYSKWRADRVMEYLLIAHKKFKWDPAPNGDNYFTIERYFTGNYKNIKPDTNFLYYPNYRLPTISEWKKAVHYADSIHYIICHDSIIDFRSEVTPCIHDTFWKYEPTESVYTGCNSKVDSATYNLNGTIYNLRGNVSEWTSEDGITIGGGWADKRQVILTQDTFHLKTENAWTGFRNVCEWKRWSK